MIKLENVFIARSGKNLISNASFCLNSGEHAVIYGPSGCGKSSLLSAIAGLYPIQSGSIEINGTRLLGKNAGLIRQTISYIPQEPIMGATTVLEALQLPYFFKANRNRNVSQEEIIEVLNSLRLSESILAQETIKLSGGEKQRVAIARALLMNKTIFLADEITNSLDQKTRQIVQELFANPAYTLLAVSHDPWHDSSFRRFSLANGKLTEEL